MQLLRLTLVLALAASASAGWGRKKEAQPVEEEPVGDVDLAMKGWEELAKDPSKMNDLMASFQDPEVVAKAYEMIKDPIYMAAAKKKMAELTAKAQANGMLDENGMPLPGAAEAAAGANPALNLAAMMAATKNAKAANAMGAPRDYEVENLERHRAGELNTAELGMANLKKAMNDPAAIAQMAQVLKDPSAMAQLKQMMADPTFQQQAKAMAQQMKADGSIPDFSAMAQQMGQQMRGAGGAGGSAAEAEIARLRAENAALKGMF